MTTMQAAGTPVVGPRDGEAWWWTGELARITTTGEQTDGHLALVEILAPQGIAIPSHVHHREDEGFWLLEGVVRFTVDGRTFDARAGDFLLGPRDVPHAYTVVDGPARMLFMFAPAGLEGFIRVAGVPASEPTLPPADVLPDWGALPALAAAYGIEMVG